MRADSFLSATTNGGPTAAVQGGWWCVREFCSTTIVAAASADKCVGVASVGSACSSSETRSISSSFVLRDDAVGEIEAAGVAAGAVSDFSAGCDFRFSKSWWRRTVAAVSVDCTLTSLRLTIDKGAEAGAVVTVEAAKAKWGETTGR